MNVYSSETEQVDQIKRWIKAYALPVIVGVIVASALTFGWRYWQEKQEQKAIEASSYYEQMQIDLMQKNDNGVNRQARYLLEQYADTPYASFAAFALAQQAVQRGDFKAAIQQLNWVIDEGKDAAFQQIAQIRLARVLISIQEAEKALEVLQKIRDESFMGGIEETRGDAYLSLNKTEAARAAYQKSLKTMPPSSPMYAFIQMKLNQLAQPTILKEATK